MKLKAISKIINYYICFPDSSVGKESACNAGHPISIPRLGRSTGEGIGYLLQHSWVSLVAQLAKKVKVKSFSRVRLSAASWTAAHQAPLSMGFPRQEYRRGQPFPSPGDLPNPGIRPTSLASPALPGGFFTTNGTWEAHRRTLEE